MSSNYQVNVSNLVCASSALAVVIEKLWHDEKSGEAYILELIRESINRGAASFDELIYAHKKQPPEPH